MQALTLQACVALPLGLFAADECVEVWSNSGQAVLDRAWKLVAYPLPPTACNAAAVQVTNMPVPNPSRFAYSLNHFFVQPR